MEELGDAEEPKAAIAVMVRLGAEVIENDAGGIAI